MQSKLKEWIDWCLIPRKDERNNNWTKGYHHCEIRRILAIKNRAKKCRIILNKQLESHFHWKFESERWKIARRNLM